MKLLLQNDNGFRWERHENSTAKGHLTTLEGQLYQSIDLPRFFTTCSDLDGLRHKIANSTGNWCAIIETKTLIISAVDRLRSFPLFYCTDGNSQNPLTELYSSILPCGTGHQIMSSGSITLTLRSCVIWISPLRWTFSQRRHW